MRRGRNPCATQYCGSLVSYPGIPALYLWLVGCGMHFPWAPWLRYLLLDTAFPCFDVEGYGSHGSGLKQSLKVFQFFYQLYITHFRNFDVGVLTRGGVAGGRSIFLQFWCGVGTRQRTLFSLPPLLLLWQGILPPYRPLVLAGQVLAHASTLFPRGTGTNMHYRGNRGVSYMMQSQTQIYWFFYQINKWENYGNVGAGH